MNAAHFHLPLNHIPVMASLFATFILLMSLVQKQKTVRQTGLIVMCVGAAFVLPVDWTGEEAEEILETVRVYFLSAKRAVYHGNTGF